MIKFFKIIAILEGFSYLTLFSNMLLVKPNNPELYHGLLYPVGMAHGMLFIAYVLTAFLLKNNQNWSIPTFILIQLASLIPFGTFYVEKKYLKNV